MVPPGLVVRAHRHGFTSHTHRLCPILCDLCFFRLTGSSHDCLGIVGLFRMLTEVGLDCLQNRRVRQGFDSRTKRLL